MSFETELNFKPKPTSTVTENSIQVVGEEVGGAVGTGINSMHASERGYLNSLPNKIIYQRGETFRRKKIEFEIRLALSSLRKWLLIFELMNSRNFVK